MFGKTDPARYIALLGAFLTLLSVFGIALTDGKIQAIMGFATIAIPVIAGELTRRSVYSPASAQVALNMPPDSNINLLDKVLETGVRVAAGDTHREVVQAVVEAEKEAALIK